MSVDAKWKRLAVWLGVVVVLATVTLASGILVRAFKHAQPEFTLFVHQVGDAKDSSNIVVAVSVAGDAKWDWSARLPGGVPEAEKVFWVEHIGHDRTSRVEGSFEVTGHELQFKPKAPLETGATYHVVFDFVDGSARDSKRPFRTGFGSVRGTGRLELIHQVP